MRVVPSLPKLIFFFIVGITAFASYLFGSLLGSLALGIIFFLIINVIIHRVLGLFMPPREAGYTDQDNLLAYDIQSMYDILFFEMILHTYLLPYPLERLFDKMMGMKLGANSYPANSYLSTPYHFISAGENVIFGAGAAVSPHTYESGGKLTIKPIKIGNNVTIGMNSVIMHGVTIEDGGIVAAGAIVTKDTHIKSGEVWAGIPAKMIRDSKGSKPKAKTKPKSRKK